MRHATMWRTLLLMTLGAASAQSAATQLPSADSAGLARTVRDLVVAMRDAARSGDWQRLEPYFPPASSWTVSVRADVTTPASRQGFSFWYPETRTDSNAWRVAVLSPDSVAIAGDFHTRGTAGTWGATFRLRNGGWFLLCESTTFPAGDWPPGCRRELHAPADDRTL